MRRKSIKYVLIGAFYLFGCSQATNDENQDVDENTVAQEKISEEVYAISSAGDTVKAYVMKNASGMEIEVINYGGIITKWLVPDKKGNKVDVVLGYNSFAEYEKETPYFGALVGRFGNRISNGKFSIGDEEYILAQNDGKNHLHGGLKGFDKVLWNVEKDEENNSLKLSYLSRDGEEGYPGNLLVNVRYTLTDDNTLELVYQATTDKSTVVNLTQHTYFNLSGDFNNSITDHELMIDADYFIPVNDELIPTGELAKVEGTPFDFTTPKLIGRDIESKHEQMLKGGVGYDHCWVLNNQDTGVRQVASAYHEGNGVYLEVYTDQPGVQFYTGNFLNGTLPAKNGGTYGHRTGFCLETQHYPDSPNQAHFPSVILEPGQEFKSATIFKFAVK